MYRWLVVLFLIAGLCSWQKYQVWKAQHDPDFLAQQRWMAVITEKMKVSDQQGKVPRCSALDQLKVQGRVESDRFCIN